MKCCSMFNVQMINVENVTANVDVNRHEWACVSSKPSGRILFRKGIRAAIGELESSSFCGNGVGPNTLLLLPRFFVVKSKKKEKMEAVNCL